MQSCSSALAHLSSPLQTCIGPWAIKADTVISEPEHCLCGLLWVPVGEALVMARGRWGCFPVKWSEAPAVHSR